MQNLPTDSFYKFLSLGSLAAFLTIIIWFTGRSDDLEERKYQLDLKLNVLEADSSNVKTYLKEQTELLKVIKTEQAVLDSAYREKKLSFEEWSSNTRAFTSEKNTLQSQLFTADRDLDRQLAESDSIQKRLKAIEAKIKRDVPYASPLLFMFASLCFWATVLWYQRVQVPLDEANHFPISFGEKISLLLFAKFAAFAFQVATLALALSANLGSLTYPASLILAVVFHAGLTSFGRRMSAKPMPEWLFNWVDRIVKEQALQRGGSDVDKPKDGQVGPTAQ